MLNCTISNLDCSKWLDCSDFPGYPGTRVANRVPGNKPGICYPVFIHFVLKSDFLQASDAENIARVGIEVIITGNVTQMTAGNYGFVRRSPPVIRQLTAESGGRRRSSSIISNIVIFYVRRQKSGYPGTRVIKKPGTRVGNRVPGKITNC